MTTEGERIDNTGEPAEESNEVDQGDTGEDAAAEADPNNEVDKVKPVIYIGLVLTALFGLGEFKDQWKLKDILRH